MSELFRLSRLDPSDEVAFKPYRISVKQRLARVNREELSVIAPIDRKARLQLFFEELEKEYQRVLNRLARIE